MRVLMTGGGTAGHVNPAIAIANTIKKYQPDAEIAFVCSHNPSDKARDLVPRAGYEKLYTVKICGMKQIYNPANIKTLYYMMTSPAAAKRIILEFKPDLIVGTGGFACYPVVREGVKLGIPTALHESNAIAGKAVKRLSRSVDLVMTNFEATASQLTGANVKRVGNPVIEGGAESTSHRYSDYSRHVLSFGGSLGAENLNLAVADMLCAIADKYPDVEFVHASGKRDYEHMRAVFDERGLSGKKNITLCDYIYDMGRRMSEAEVVISRAGAMTVSELALGGKAAILVPSPYVADNHQYKNARALYDVGAGLLVQESELASGRLTEEVERLLQDKSLRDGLSEKIRSFAEPEANSIIYSELMSLVKGKGN